MILLNHIKLAEALGQQQLTEQQKFRYLFTYIVVSLIVSLVLALGFALPTAPSDSNTTSAQAYSIIAEVIGLFLFIGGIIIAYQVNEKGDDKDFVVRYVSLAVPLTFQALGIFLGIFSTFILFMSVVISPDMAPNARRAVVSESIGLATLASLLLSYLYFYVSIIMTMRIASKQTNVTPTGKKPSFFSNIQTTQPY